MSIHTRKYADGTTIYIRTDEDGNQHRLNSEEESAYLKARAYKRQLASKVGTGAAIATGMAAGELALGTVGAAAETAFGIAEGIALAPTILTIAAIGGVGYLGYRAFKAISE